MSKSTDAQPIAAVGTDQHREDAALYVRRLRGFYLHAGICAASLVVIFAVNLATNIAAGIAAEWWAWWSGWALLGCSLGLMVHAAVLRMSRPRATTTTWEEEKLAKILMSQSG